LPFNICQHTIHHSTANRVVSFSSGPVHGSWICGYIYSLSFSMFLLALVAVVCSSPLVTQGKSVWSVWDLFANLPTFWGLKAENFLISE
jgi:hypothetical protein